MCVCEREKEDVRVHVRIVFVCVHEYMRVCVYVC